MPAMKRSVLLVEDDAVVALTNKRILEKAGYAVETAPNGETAVAAVESNHEAFELVLMDIDLGDGIDGTQAAEQIISEVDIPVVFLSSHTEPEVVEKTEGITSYGYVVKSSSPTVLFASMKMAFKLHAAKQAVQAAEKRVAEQRDKLRVMMDSSRVGMMLINSELYVIDANRAAERIAGRKLNQVEQRRCGDFLGCAHAYDATELCGDAPECPECELYADIQATVAGERTVYGKEREMQLQSREGCRAALLRYSTASMSLDGRPAALVNIEDVTATRLERQRTQLLSSIAYNPGNIVFITDAERRTQWVNDAGIELTGYSEKELLGRNPGEILQGPNPDPALKREIRAALDAGRSYAGEILNYTKHGAPYWIRMHINPVHDAAGRITHYVAIQHNVTERRRVQDRLVKQSQAVQQVFERSGVGMLFLDSSGKIRSVNPAYAEITGCPTETLLGAGASEIAALIHPDDQHIVAKINQAIAQGSHGAVYRYRFLSCEGVYLWREDHAVFFYDVEGRHESSYVFVRQISEIGPGTASFETFTD